MHHLELDDMQMDWMGIGGPIPQCPVFRIIQPWILRNRISPQLDLTPF